MRVLIVGGGPAGLYLAILLRKLGHEVQVREAGREERLFGWGVVLPPDSAAFLEQHDLASFRALASHMVQWDSIDVLQPTQTSGVDGVEFFSVSYDAVIEILRARLRELGGELIYQREVRSLADLDGYDLVVGADGVDSYVRRLYRRRFGARMEAGHHRYAWFRTPRIFDALTYVVQQTAAGTFFGQGYRFNADTSTFLVECSDATWQNAGLGKIWDGEGRRQVQQIFAEALKGAPLVTTGPTQWSRYRQLTVDRWSHDNVVLIGDALHTTHYSIGSGIRLAFMDAAALAQSLERQQGLDRALAEFEQQQKPVIQEFQRASLASMRWLERIDEHLLDDPSSFAYELVTTTRRVTPDRHVQLEPRSR